MSDANSNGSPSDSGGYLTLPERPLGGSPISLAQALNARLATTLLLTDEDRVMARTLVAYAYKAEYDSHLSFLTWLGYVADMVAALVEEAGPEALDRAFEKAKYKR